MRIWNNYLPILEYHLNQAEDYDSAHLQRNCNIYYEIQKKFKKRIYLTYDLSLEILIVLKLIVPSCKVLSFKSDNMLSQCIFVMILFKICR